jgi:hypothetical protein
MVEIHSLGQVLRPVYTQLHATASVFPQISLVDCLALWNEFKVNNILHIKEVTNIFLMCDFNMRAPFEQFVSLKNTWHFHNSRPTCLAEYCTVSLAFPPNLTQKVMLIRCSKNRDVEIRRISSTTPTQLALMRWNRNRCKLKHTQTCLYQDQVAWLPLSHVIKSFRELHSHIMYTSVNPQLNVIWDPRFSWKWLRSRFSELWRHVVLW